MEQDRNPARTTTVAVVGGGPAGLTAALTLASAGIDTALIAKRTEHPDNRTTALLASSVAALDVLGVWERCRDQAAALRTMRIVDDTARLWRAPEVSFNAAEIGLEAFGWNIENRHLVAALAARAAESPSLRQIDGEATGLTIDADGVTVSLGDGSNLRATLVVGADGRNSRSRAAAGIRNKTWRYPQTALTFNLSHTRPHHDVSTEFHTGSGPFTLVPLPGLRSSLVCVLDPEEAEHVAGLGPETLATELERRSHSILGKITVEPGRGRFPLAGETALCFGSRRVALIGEAAHVLPPIGAQGLNLGLRDAATIGELVIDAFRRGEDVGAPPLLAQYDRLRRPDVASRTLAVDLLNRTLLSDFLPLQGARGLGLYLLDRVGPLRRALMREGVAPRGEQPRMMRGEPL
ncbi:MAG TPA: UbiH/UbiF family hydroxylase [Xanthobacteraceae bacterium]|nr:UbiH/UbiF family hydroxylase [Xanthobacteraceae bacterium]